MAWCVVSASSTTPWATKFSTYASWWVRRFQQLAVIAAAPAKVSHADAARIGEVLAAEHDLSHELHRAHQQ